MADDELRVDDPVAQPHEPDREVFVSTAVADEEIGFAAKLAPDVVDDPHVDGSQ